MDEKLSNKMVARTNKNGQVEKAVKAESGGGYAIFVDDVLIYAEGDYDMAFCRLCDMGWGWEGEGLEEFEGLE